MSSSIRHDLVAALGYQRKRCEVYHRWDQQFLSVLTGELKEGDLASHIQQVVIKEFQEISRQLRELQDRVQLSLKCDASGTVSPSEPSTHQCGVKHAVERRFLCQWIEKIQNVEREHYQAAVELASVLASHCAPNVCRREVLEQKESSSVVANASGDEKEKSLEDGSACDAALSVNNSRTSKPRPTLSVHDVERCALPKAVPRIAEVGLLYFVTCKGYDGLGCADNPEELHEGRHTALNEDGDGSSHDDDVRLESLMCDEEVARYDPCAVGARCASWSAKVAPLLTRKAALQKAAEDLCEELQCELSDLLD